MTDQPIDMGFMSLPAEIQAEALSHAAVPLREQIIAALEGVSWACSTDADPGSCQACNGCRADAVLAVIEPMLWRARNLVYGKCRYCGAVVEPAATGARRATPHRMRCRHYVGPLEHHWINTRVNGTFGGVDYDCVCGGSTRRGGLAGAGDGSETAEPVCPNAGQMYREAAT